MLLKSPNWSLTRLDQIFINKFTQMYQLPKHNYMNLFQYKTSLLDKHYKNISCALYTAYILSNKWQWFSNNLLKPIK